MLLIKKHTHTQSEICFEMKKHNRHGKMLFSSFEYKLIL